MCTSAGLSDLEIDGYTDSGEAMDKAGAYGIQGLASKFVGAGSKDATST